MREERKESFSSSSEENGKSVRKDFLGSFGGLCKRFGVGLGLVFGLFVTWLILIVIGDRLGLPFGVFITIGAIIYFCFVPWKKRRNRLKADLARGKEWKENWDRVENKK